MKRPRTCKTCKGDLLYKDPNTGALAACQKCAEEKKKVWVKKQQVRRFWPTPDMSVNEWMRQSDEDFRRDNEGRWNTESTWSGVVIP